MSSPITRALALRVLDANANRAAEGLRTLEDIARLIRENASAAERIKTLRHRLGTLLGYLPRDERLAARSTESDAGTNLTSLAEVQRSDLPSLISSACERVTQALRQLEEFGKTVTPEFASQIKQLRYDAYDELAELELLLTQDKNPFERAQLYLLIDCRLPLADFQAYIASLAEAGVDAIQLRDKQAEAQQLLEYAHGMRETLSKSQTLSIVNDRVDIALAAEVNAVHVGQEDLPLADVRRLAKHRLRVGVSTHDLPQVLEAEQAGADYIGCGPTFPSQTKQFEQFAGPAFLREVAGHATLPYFAIGGIQLESLDAVLETGCQRVCVSHAIHAADHPPTAAARMKGKLVDNRQFAEQFP